MGRSRKIIKGKKIGADVINLLNDKLELVKKIEELTQNILEISLEDDKDSISSIDKYNQLMDKRQTLMNKIDIIDDKLSRMKSDSNQVDDMESKGFIEANIKTVLKKIIDIDKKIKLNTEKELVSVKTRLNEIDKRLKTSDYELNEEDKKPKGFFLDTNS